MRPALLLVSDVVRRMASAGALICCAACASAPVPSRGDRPAPIATDWVGERGEPPEASAAGALAATEAPDAPDDPSVAAGHAGSAPAPWVLHVGDSFVHAFLWQTLRPLFLADHTQYVVQAATSTYTTTWASSPELEGWLARRPALVIVTLGANEADMTIPELHARAVETLAKKIAATGASCVWVTPPMWKAENGILDVIHDHCAPCIFFDSDAVLGGLSKEERQGDRIHPNRRGGERWARAFWQWLQEHRDTSRGPWALDAFERRG